MFGHLLKFILDIVKSGKEEKLLRPLPSMALICTVYGPLKMFAKMMEEGELLYSLELEEELADSFWNAIRLQRLAKSASSLNRNNCNQC
uniref:hypothetical protein n=1 Tax=Paenibacillus sp. FSL E2-0177 TaxID=2921360 RepID=UPI00403F7679